MQTPRAPSLLQTTLAILWKDLTIELRTREIVTTAGFFAVLVTIMASVAFYAGEDTAKRQAGKTGCCQPFCEFPNAPCPNPDQQCVQWFPPDEIPPGAEDLGVCAVPS